MTESLPVSSSSSLTKLTDRLRRSFPMPALLQNTVFARWDSVTGPTVCRAWPELAQAGCQFAGDPNLATEPTVLTSELARFIARNCLTAEITNSANFSNRINSRIFTVPEIGLVAYALVFACIPLPQAKPSRSIQSRHGSITNPVVFLTGGNAMSGEQLFAWFFLFDAPVTRVIEMRTILEQSMITRHIYLLRVALARGLETNNGDSREVNSPFPTQLMELLDLHAVVYEKIFTAFASCILLPTIRFTSTSFAVDMQIPATDDPIHDDSPTSNGGNNEGDDISNHRSLPTPIERKSSLTRPLSWFRGSSGSTANVVTATANDNDTKNEENCFLRRSIAAFLASGGRALVLGQSTKSVNALIHTLALFLPLHCRRLCRLAAARPNERFIPGFYVQGVVGAPYPSGPELLASPHALAVCNTHDRTVCRTPIPSKHRLAASAFLAAQIRDAWEGIHQEEMMMDEGGTATPLATLPLTDNIPNESIVGEFLVKLTICPPLDNAHRQRFVDSAVADFYSRACCLMQLVEHSLEEVAKQQQQQKQQKKMSPTPPSSTSPNATVVITRREIAKLLDLHNQDGDLAVLVGVGELLQPGFADIFERCPP